MQQPAVQRRRWIIRLIAAFAVVTLLIFGFLVSSRALLNRGDTPQDTGNSSTGQPGVSSGQDDKPRNNDLKPPENLRQEPKKNTLIPVDSSKADVVVQGGDTVKSTVRKPE